MDFDNLHAVEVVKGPAHWIISFAAMASPCEIHTECDTEGDAKQLASLAYAETTRLERKFSRYRDDNIIHAINTGHGKAVNVDEETAQLLHYAEQCYRLSGGLFDVTSGVLRKAWTFNGQETTPDLELIASLCEIVGWEKVEFDRSQIRIRPGMEIDLGGIGKEYAVDKVAQLVFDQSQKPVMVNFGGDIRAISGDSSSKPWSIGIEDPRKEGNSLGLIELRMGAVATSGLTHRFCIVNGLRLGHILNPRTGWPAADMPRSVTVVADFCLEAGFFTTLAMLHGKDAERFLKDQGVTHFCRR